MAKNIIDMVREKRDTATIIEQIENMTMGIAAMKSGIGSDAWRAYMIQFVEQNPPGHPVDPAQLERLMGADQTMGDARLDRRRAYLVANACCGATTFSRLDYGVESIDHGLKSAEQCLFREECNTGQGILAVGARYISKGGGKKKTTKKKASKK